MPRPRRLRIGLRGRFGIALVATGMLTLVAATAAMLPLLEQRLESQRLGDLRALARTARPALRALPPKDLHPGSRPLRAIADDLAWRTGGRIVVTDQTGAVLTDTAPTRSDPGAVPLDPARARALRRGGGVVSLTREDRGFAVTVVHAGRDELTVVIAKRLDDEATAVAVARAALPPAGAASLVVAVLLALALSRSLLARLDRLRHDARALGQEGLEHLVSVRGDDEVSEVAGALEEMRGRLVEEEASRRAFIATASHELRTPLSSLQATLELLREEVEHGDADPAVAASRAELALRQTSRLTALAGDLLDLSRVDGNVPLHPEPIELRELAETVAREFNAPLARAQRALELEGGPVIALADPGAAVRILRVLLENALRHGSGAVSVAVSGSHGGPAHLVVTDEGDGIDPAERERVFVRFARGRAAAGRPGTGLGLSIARALARAMDGELAALGGARLDLTLPGWAGDGEALTASRAAHGDATRR